MSRPMIRMARDGDTSSEGPVRESARLAGSSSRREPVSDVEAQALPQGEPERQDVARRIAVLAASDPDRDFIVGTLRATDHLLVEFSRLKDLAQALFTGEKFDLLLLSLEGDPDAVLSGLKFIRRLVGDAAALLLLVQPEQLLANKHLASRMFSDLLVMPCEDNELLVRVARAIALSEEGQEVFVFGRYAFDPVGRTISADGQRVRLQPRQFQLALYLFRHANRAHSREEITAAVWGKRHPPEESRTIDVHMTRLRKTLMAMSSGDVSLISIRSFGYRLYLDTRQNGKPAAQPVPVDRGAGKTQTPPPVQLAGGRRGIP